MKAWEVPCGFWIAATLSPPFFPLRMATVAPVMNPTRKILVGEWYANHAAYAGDEGWFAPGGKRLYLFADGHVEYLASDKLNLANDGLPNPNLTHNGIRGQDVP